MRRCSASSSFDRVTASRTQSISKPTRSARSSPCSDHRRPTRREVSGSRPTAPSWSSAWSSTLVAAIASETAAACTAAGSPADTTCWRRIPRRTHGAAVVVATPSRRCAATRMDSTTASVLVTTREDCPWWSRRVRQSPHRWPIHSRCREGGNWWRQGFTMPNTARSSHVAPPWVGNAGRDDGRHALGAPPARFSRGRRRRCGRTLRSRAAARRRPDRALPHVRTCRCPRR